MKTTTLIKEIWSRIFKVFLYYIMLYYYNLYLDIDKIKKCSCSVIFVLPTVKFDLMFQLISFSSLIQLWKKKICILYILNILFGKVKQLSCA